MKFIFALLIASSSVFGLFAITDPYPKLVFIEKRVIDMGEVIQGETVRKAFIIKNEGQVPLDIHNIHKSCNCTEARLGKSTLNPNDTTALFVVVNTDGKIGDTSINVVIDRDGGEYPW